MNYKSLQNNLKNNSLDPIYLFTGKERFLANQAVQKIKKQIVNPATSELNFIRFSDKSDSVGDILSHAQTLPFMSEKRLVVIDEGVGLMEMSGENTIKAFNDYIKDPTATSVVIILSEKVDKRRQIYKLLKNKAQIVDFKPLNYSEISSFILNKLHKFGITINNSDLKYLITRLNYLDNENANLEGVNLEIDKLIDYIGKGGVVNREAINETIPESLEDNVFKIIDLIIQGRLNGVYEILENLWETGQSPISLLGLLVYQLRNILKVKLCLTQGISQKNLASKTGLKPFIVRKTTPIATQFTLERLMELYNELAKLDLEVKTGRVEADSGLELFLLKLFKRK